MKNSLNIKSLGAIKSPKDKRDFKLGQVQLPIEIPNIYLPDISSLPIYMQGKQPACGGHAGAWWKTFSEFLSNESVMSFSPRFLYALCKRDDGYPNDAGTFLRQILAELKNNGICEEFIYPNDVSLDPDVYCNATLIPQEAFINATSRRVKSYAFLNDLSFDGIKQSIYQNKMVVLYLNLGNEWWTAVNGIGSWSEKDILPLRPPKRVVSGHFVVLYGYDENYIYFVNSFSNQWGRKGIGYFGKNYIPFIKEGGTIIDLPDEVIINLKKQKTLLEKIVELFTNFLNKKKVVT